jgi:hypothetical protein
MKNGGNGGYEGFSGGEAAEPGIPLNQKNIDKELGGAEEH